MRKSNSLSIGVDISGPCSPENVSIELSAWRVRFRMVANILISRRQAIKFSMAASGALVLGVPGIARSAGLVLKRGHLFDAWIELGTDNSLRFSLDKVEMGQGVVNSLVTIFAEEISTHPELISVLLPTVGAGQSNPLYVPTWGTGASSSVYNLWPRLREAGAVLQFRMRRAAADRWHVDMSGVTVRNAHVYSSDGNESFEFAELVTDVLKLSELEGVEYKKPADYQWVGRTIPNRDSEPKLHGKAEYGLDYTPEKTSTAVVVRCPFPGGNLVAHGWENDEPPEGVGLLPLGNKIVLIGSDFHLLSNARRKLVADWQPVNPLPENNDELEQRLLDGLDEEGETAFCKGFSVLPKNNQPTLEASYMVPYLAHAPLEPMNCTIVVEDGAWKIWAPTQKPNYARKIALEISQLPEEKVTVHTGYIGGGFGRRLRQDYVREACQIAKVLDHSIKVIWSREDDFQHGFYRPAVAARIQAWADSGGLEELSVDLASSEAPLKVQNKGFVEELRASLDRWWRGLRGEPMVQNQAVDGFSHLIYAASVQKVDLRLLDLGIPTGFWRSVGNSFNGFFIESFIDELAWHFKQDPVEYRLQLVEKKAAENVLRRVRELSDWVNRLDRGESLGVAAYHCFGTAVAMVIQVEAEEGRLRVCKVWCVIDCGIAIDPDGVRKQMESSVNYGLCAALFGELTIANGKVASSNFNDYPVLRIHQSPEIEVEIVPSENPPTGVGEPATPLVAPALCNAVFTLTGTRIRKLPLRNALKDQLTM